ncbi:MAG: nitrile hydratase subunit beta [Stellaceae bacterium]
MNGIHDMGGMHGFGPVEPEPDEPVFHAAWEGRILAMQRATGYAGLWTIDMSRAAQEALPPQVYLSASYYERWALGLERLLLEHRLVTSEELASGHAMAPGTPLPRKLTAADVNRGMTRGSFGRPAPAPACFKPGDRVRTANRHPVTHTRLPRYARGRVGVIEQLRGCHVFPDTVAIGEGECPQWLYTVVFEGRELWGESSDPTIKVSIEAWESYLELAP